MSKITYVAPYVDPLSYKRVAVHVSVSTEKYLTADVHDVTVCGTKIPLTGWREVPRPTEGGWESNLSRCKRCDHKRIEGVPAFDYEEELASREHRRLNHGRYSQCDGTRTVDCGHCKGAGWLYNETSGVLYGPDPDHPGLRYPVATDVQPSFGHLIAGTMNRPAHVPASVPDSEVDQYLDFYPTKEA